MSQCPICQSAPSVRSTSMGYACHCSGCYEADEGSPYWCLIQGVGQTEELAIEHWLTLSRECAAWGDPPSLRLPLRVATLFADLEAQVNAEAQRQRGWILFKDPFNRPSVWVPPC